ncbi:MAG: HlyD family type I secretion periplasmic adaptor subunit [Janthinobacterium lividum]
MSDAIKSPAGPLWIDLAEESLPQASLRRVALLSVLITVLGLGGVLAWASLASVDSAVPASGVVVASGKRKTITLLEGGILHKLLVHEGDQVQAGQVLLQLDDVQVRAARDQAKVQYWSAMAKMTRLAAEAADQRTLEFPAQLRDVAATDPAVDAGMTAEMRQFEVRWNAFDSSVRVQDRKVAQQQAQIASIRAQSASVQTRLSFTDEELTGVNFLMSRGLSTKSHQLDVLRTQADMRGQIGQLNAQHVQAMQTIGQIQYEIINTAESRRADISRERAETQSALSDADQRLRAAADQLNKREIISPEAGTITDLKFYTVGSSISAGQPIMDLVPSSQHLLIEGNVSPNEVEHLRVGQAVNVRLTAYKAHRVPVITAHLTYVGADRQMDTNNQPFFQIRAELEPDALNDKPGVVLLPGMPADVIVINGRRSVLSFLVSPISDSLFHAMREE